MCSVSATVKTAIALNDFAPIGWLRRRCNLDWTEPVFPLKAADFIKRGVEKGPELGAALAAAEKAWIAAGFPSDAGAIEAIADSSIAGKS